jgi:replicative DNA helicase
MNNNIEEIILGHLLLKPELFKRTVITGQHFLSEENKFIFNLLKKQYEDIQSISIIGLAETYKTAFTIKHPANKIIPKLTELLSDTLLQVNDYDYFQDLLFQKYIDNEMLLIINQFKSQQITKEEMLEGIHKLENMSIKLYDNRLNSKEIFQLINSKNKNISFRFKKLSDTANIQEHDLVIIAARTGLGKSGFCLNLLEDLSDQYNCLYFNMEISEKQIYQRLVSINSKIDMKYLDSPATPHQKEAIERACENISKKQIKIYSQGQTVASIRRKIMNECKNGHTIAFIDHVGLIKAKKESTLYENLTGIVKELRQISLDYDCTIFLVSQLNRSADNKQLPKISELKDSGELEQSATTVILMHDELQDKNISKDEVNISFLIGKNRNGSLGLTKYSYNKLTQRFD